MTEETTSPGAANSFESLMGRMTEITERLEGEDLELDESLALYEEGVRLARRSEEILRTADARVSQLIEDSGEILQVPVDPTV